MPVYNAGEYVGDAIESILAQSYKNFELIIINDGSRDKSHGIISEFAVKDKRIQLISRANKGLIASLNEGLDTARGDFIARQDADDISLPGRLQAQVDFLQKHPEIGLLGTNIEVINEKGDKVSKKIANVDFLTSPDDLKLAEVFSNQFAHGSIMAKAALLKMSRYDRNYKHAEDFELWSRISHHSQIANLKEPLYQWRLHQSGVTSANTSEMTSKAVAIAGREFDYYLEHKADYQFFSFHPFSMRGGVKTYLLRKSSLYRDMAYMYTRHGSRRKALPIVVLAILHSPWLKKNYRFLFRLMASRQKALSLEYELF
jgi:glycosyltransferase involved in cell wall biosynthesis